MPGASSGHGRQWLHRIQWTIGLAGVVAGLPAPAAPAAPAASSVAVAVAENPYETQQPRVARGPIDQHVFSRLAALQLTPAHPVSDATFLRRVHFDLIGRLPSAAEARRFLKDQSADKRDVLIEQLLARPEFADYWSLKWSDLLRVKAEYPINLWPNAAQAYHRWIYSSLLEDKPLDQFARELLISSGSNVHCGPVNFYRAIPGRDPLSVAKSVALTFMGTRPEAWSADQWSGMAGFFAQIGYKSTGEWKEEIVLWDPARPATSGVGPARFPDGTTPVLSPERDPRVIFADWLLAPGNPWFARVLANRVWSWIFSRGIVHQPDDFRDGNAPVNPALLAYLEQELVRSRYSLKHLFRLIVQSQTYQLSCVPRSSDPAAASEFAHYALRRLEAEVLIDAINDITGTSESYSSAIPEPYTFVPADVRAVALPDGSITSSFLELFGRPPRDSGLESERSLRVTAGQRLHLLNSSHVRKKIEQGPALAELLRIPPDRAIDAIYLTVLSRFPTNEERRTLRPSPKAGGTATRAVALDLIWALLNSDEFLHRH